MRYYLNLKDKNFKKSLCAKKEFRLKSLNKTTHLKKHQIWLSNFINYKTPYKSLFIYHEVGTGKTCSAISIAEKFKNDMSYADKKIVIVAPLDALNEFTTNFYNKDNSFKCAGTIYEQELIDDGLEVNKDNVMKKINNFYTFKTIDAFQKMPLKSLDNTIIIIDEAHKIKYTEKENKRDIHKHIEQIVKLNDVRLVFMSGTPIVDKAQEILWFINIMNMNDTHDKDKFKKLTEDEIFDLNDNIKDEKKLIDAIDGHFTYLKSADTNIPLKLFDSDGVIPNMDIDFFGKKIPNSKKFPNYKSIKLTLSKITNEHEKYIQDNILNQEIADEKKQNAFNIKAMTTNISYKELNKRKIEKNPEETLPENFSPKCNTIARLIEENQGISYIYSNYVEKGIDQVIYVLEKKGYKLYNQNLSKGKNYFKEFTNIKSNNQFYIRLTSGKETSPSDIRIFKSDQNKNGEIIKVCLATNKYSTGVDFKNVRNIHILEANNNFGNINQAIGRGIRIKSHDNLDKEFRNTTVYYHATEFINNPKRETIDMHLYKKSIEKQMRIERIFKILKDNSITCTFFKDLNDISEDEYKNTYGDIIHKSNGEKIKFTKDLLVDQEIIKCAFECDNNTKLDKDSYNYELHEQFTILRIMKSIENIFKTYDIKLSFDDIKIIIQNEYDLNDLDESIKYALHEMIYKKIEFKNVYNLNGRIVFDEFYYFIYIDDTGNEHIFNENLISYNSSHVELKDDYLIQPTKISSDTDKIQFLKELEIIININFFSNYKEYVFLYYILFRDDIDINDIPENIFNENEKAKIVSFINQRNDAKNTRKLVKMTDKIYLKFDNENIKFVNRQRSTNSKAGTVFKTCHRKIIIDNLLEKNVIDENLKEELLNSKNFKLISENETKGEKITKDTLLKISIISLLIKLREENKNYILYPFEKEEEDK